MKAVQTFNHRDSAEMFGRDVSAYNEQHPVVNVWEVGNVYCVLDVSDLPPCDGKRVAVYDHGQKLSAWGRSDLHMSGFARA